MNSFFKYFVPKPKQNPYFEELLVSDDTDHIQIDWVLKTYNRRRFSKFNRYSIEIKLSNDFVKYWLATRFYFVKIHDDSTPRLLEIYKY